MKDIKFARFDNMENDKRPITVGQMRRAIIFGGIPTLILAACGADAILNPDHDQNPSAFPTSEIDPTVEIAKITSATLTEITDQTEKEATIASLPQDRPATKDGNENIAVYSMKVGDVDFKMASYFLTDEQVQKQIEEGLVFTDPKTKLQWTPRSVVYIAGVNANNNFEWGLYLPEVSGIGTETQDISWTYYTSHFPNNASEVQPIVRNVFTYQMHDKEPLNISFTPVISEPYASNPNYIPGYTGPEIATPLDVNIKNIDTGAGKVLFSLIPPESQLPEGAISDLAKELEGTDYGLTWNEDKSAIVLTYTDPETKEKTNIPEIESDKEGIMTIVYENQEYLANSNTVQIDGQKLTFQDKDGNIWILNGQTLTREAEVAEYPIEKDPYKFRNCVIELSADSDTQSMIDYVKSLKKYHSTDRFYDQNKLMFNKLINYSGEIFYDINAPDYTDPESRPFERGAFCLTKFTTSEGKVIEYFTSFVQYYQQGLAPENYPWVVFVAPTRPPTEEAVTNVYINDMNFPVFVNSVISQSALIEGDDPLSEATTFSKFNDMDSRFKAATEGDMTKLDGELGIILQVKIRKSSGNAFK